MKKIVVFGTEIEVNDSYVLMTKLCDKYDKLVKKEGFSYAAVMSETIKTNADYLTHGEELRNAFLGHINHDIVQSLIDQGFYDIDEDSYLRDFLIKYIVDSDWFSLTNERCDDIEERINEILQLQENAELNRKVRQMYGGTWMGGGFGLKGAIKGAATASVLNAASSAASGISNSVRNAVSGMYANSKIKAILDEEFIFTDLVWAFYKTQAAFLKAEWDFIESVSGKLSRPGKNDITRSTNIINNIAERNLPDEEVKAQIIRAIKLDPTNGFAYQYIIEKFGDKDKHIEGICRELYIGSVINPMFDSQHKERGESTFKEELLYNIYDNGDKSTVQSIQALYEEIKEKAKFYGTDIPQNLSDFVDNDIKRIEDKEKTYKGIIYTSKDEKTLAAQEDAEIINIIGATDRNNLQALRVAKQKILSKDLKAFNPSNYISEIDKLIEKAEKQERTVDGIEYDSTETAVLIKNQREDLERAVAQCNDLNTFISLMNQIKASNYKNEVKEYGISLLSSRAQTVFERQLSVYNGNKEAREEGTAKSIGCGLVLWIVIVIAACAIFAPAGVVAFILFIMYIIASIYNRHNYKKNKNDFDVIDKLKQSGFNI